MPGPVGDQRITDLIPDMLPERMRDSEETYKLFLEEYYKWLEYIKIDFVEDISTIFSEGAILIGETSFARAIVKSIPTPYCAYVEYTSTEKFKIGEEVATEQLSWDDEVQEHGHRFDVDFWSLSPGRDYSAEVQSFTYNAAIAASYMMNLQDVDSTDSDIFVETIRDSMLHGWPELASKSYDTPDGAPGSVNERQLAKMIKDYGLQKGTDKSMEFLFRLIFGEEADIYYPKDFMLRTSDGRWEEPNVTFVRNIKPNGFVLEDFVGKRIRGKTSGVEAIVVNSYKNSVPGKDVSVLVLETPKDAAPGEQGGGPWTPGNHTANNLMVGETIEVLPATFIEEEDWSSQPDNVLTATIFGGLREVDICSAGSGYAPGDTVTFSDRGGVTATANVRLVSNNYAVDFIRVDSQGTGYQVGDEVVYYPAYSGGKNGKAIVETLVDTYSMIHSNTAIQEYAAFTPNSNGVFGAVVGSALNANNGLYYTVHMGVHLDMNTDTTGNTLLVYNTSHFAVGDNVEYLNDTGTYDTAQITGIRGTHNEILELRLDTQPFGLDEDHPLYSTTEIRSTTYTHANGGVMVSNGITHTTANVTIAAMQIGDTMAFQTEVFGGVGSILVESTGIEYYDIPAVTVVGRSNVATDTTACYAERLASDARYSTAVGASTSAYNVVTMAVDENAIIFANGFTDTDPDYPKSRIAVMELLRTEEDGIGEQYKRYVWGRNGSGEVRAELVGVLEQESISYFIQEETPAQIEAGDSYYMLSEEDPDREDQIMAEGDAVFIKVKFDGEVSDPFYQGQTFVVTDNANTVIGQFDATLVYDFMKQGRDATLTVPFLATNSIFDLAVVDPGSDYSNVQKPVGDERDLDVRNERQNYLGFHNLNAILIPVLGGTIKYSGRWLNDKGKLDSSMVVQDSFFYQDFSYVLRSKLEIAAYRDVVKKLVHMAGHQLWGEVMIVTRANAQLYSGGDYGGKYDPNHIHDGSFIPTEALGGPSGSRPFLEVIRYFGYLGELNPDGTGKPDIIFSPVANGTGYDHPKAIGPDQVGAFDVLLHHEPILHDGLFYANGAPINYIYTPGKQYNNQEVFNRVDTMIADDKEANYFDKMLMEHGGQIYYEFDNEVLNNQPSHGEYVNWYQFHQDRRDGKIVWIDDSLQAQRFGLNIDDSWEGAWYRVDPEGNHLLTQDGDSLVSEDSNQDVLFPEVQFNAGTGLIVITETNSVDITFSDANFPVDIKPGQEISVEMEYFVPRFEDSGFTIDIREDFTYYEAEAHLNYDEYIVDVHNPVQLTSDHNFRSVDVTNPLGDNNDRFNFSTNIPFSQSGLKIIFESPIGSEHYIEDDAGNVGLYKNNGEDFSQTPFTVMLEYVSGHRWGSTPGTFNVRMAYYITEDAISILSQGPRETTTFSYSPSPNITAGASGPWTPGWLREVSSGLTGRYSKFGPTTHGQSRFEEGSDFIGNGGASYTYDVFTPRTDLDGQTITISEIGNDYNVSNNTTLPAVYRMEAIDASAGKYRPVHVGGATIDWGGTSDKYIGGPGHVAFSSSIRSAIAQTITVRDKDTDTVITDLAGQDVEILSVEDNTFTQVDTLLDTDLGGASEMDVFPGHVYGTFTVDGVVYEADVRYRGGPHWGTVAAGLTEGDTMMARYHGGFGDGSAKVLSIDSTNQIIYMKGTPGHMMISWSNLSNTDKDIFKREQVPTTHITGTATREVPSVYNFNTHIGSGKYAINYVSGPVINFGVGDNWSGGFVTDFKVKTTQQLVVQDQDGNPATFATDDITITEALPLVTTPKLDTTNFTLTQNTSGKHHYFADVDSTGLSFGDMVWLTGTKPTGESVRIPMKVTGTSSLTLTTDNWTSDFSFPGTFTLNDTEVSKYSVSNSSGDFPATYTFTQTATTGVYDVTHVDGAVLDWGGLNDLYNQGMTTPIVVVNASAATSVPDWKKQTISLTGEVIDANTTSPIVHFDVNLPEGIYYFTDMTGTRPSLVQTFQGGFGQPIYFEQEISSRDATFIRYDFMVPNYFIDGTIQLYSLKEVEFNLEVAHLWQSDHLEWGEYDPTQRVAPLGNQSHFPEAPGTNYLNGGLDEEGRWVPNRYGRNQQNRGGFTQMDIEFIPASDGSSMTAHFDPPRTNIVHGHEAIEITELITFPVEVGLDPIEIELPPGLINAMMISSDDIEPYYWHRQIEIFGYMDGQAQIIDDLEDHRVEYEMIIDVAPTMDILDYEVEVSSINEDESNILVVPFGSNQGRIEQQGSIFDFLNEETDGYLKQEASENYLLDPVEIEYELYIVQQVNVAIGDFEMDSQLYTTQLPFDVHREEVEIEFKHYPAVSVLFGQKDEDYIAWRGDDGSGYLLTEDGHDQLVYEGIPRTVLQDPMEKERELTVRYNSFTPPTPQNLALEDGTGYIYEDGGYVWSEGDYTPHNPWGFGVNPWRVIIEEGEVRNELDLTSEAILIPIIIPDEHSVEFDWRDIDAIPMNDIIVYNHNRDREDYIDYQLADLIMENEPGHILGEDGIGFAVISQGQDYFFYIANTDLPNLYHRQIEIELDIETPTTVIADREFVHYYESRIWVLPPEAYIDWSPEGHFGGFPCMLTEDNYRIVDENYNVGLPPYEIGRICFEPATFPPDDQEWHQIEIELIANTQPVLPPAAIPPLLDEIIIGPPTVILENEIEPGPPIPVYQMPLPYYQYYDLILEDDSGHIIDEDGVGFAVSARYFQNVPWIIHGLGGFELDEGERTILYEGATFVSEPIELEKELLNVYNKQFPYYQYYDLIQEDGSGYIIGEGFSGGFSVWDRDFLNIPTIIREDPISDHLLHLNVDASITGTFDPVDNELQPVFDYQNGVMIWRVKSQEELEQSYFQSMQPITVATILEHVNPFPRPIFVGTPLDQSLQVEGQDNQMVLAPAMTPLVKPNNDFAEMEYQLPINFITDSLETFADCNWGRTTWDAYLTLSGVRSRIQVSGALDATTDETYGDNGEVQFWRFDGPDNISIQEKSKELRLAAGASGQNRFFNHQALIALWDNPQYWDGTQFQSATYNYSGPSTPSHDGYAHTINPFTVTTTIKLHDNGTWDNYDTIWSWGRFNHNHREAAGARLFTMSGLIHFFLGGGSNWRDNTTFHLSFVPSVPFGTGNVFTHGNTAGGDILTDGPSSSRMLENPNSVTYGSPDQAIKWYQMTITYDGSPVGYVGSGNTGLTQAEMMSNIKSGWKFYFTNMASGEVVEADFLLTTFDRDGVLGFAGGDQYQHLDGSGTPRRNMFGFASNMGGENNYVFEGKWAEGHFIDEGLTKEELQGDQGRRNGFALDPIGFQRERQLTGNPVDETNAGFWSFSYHSQKDDTSSAGTANNLNNIFATTPQDSDLVLFRGDAHLANHREMIPDCNQWSYNYSDDRIGGISGINIISYVDEERPIEPVPIILDESIVLSSIDYNGDVDIVEVVNLGVNDEARPPDFGRGLMTILTEADGFSILTEDDEPLLGPTTFDFGWIEDFATVEIEKSCYINVAIQAAFTKFGDQEIPEVREFIDNFPITPTITQEFKFAGGFSEIEINVSNTINIFGGHTSNGQFDSLFVDKNPQPLLNGVASAVTDLGDVRTQHESLISAYTFDQSDVEYFFLSSEADVDLFTEDDQEIEFPNTIATSGSLIISEVSKAGLATYTELTDIILGPLDMAPTVTPLYSDDSSIDLTILPPTDAGSFMGGALSVAASPSVTINMDVDIPEDIISTMDSQASASSKIEKRTISRAFAGMGLNQEQRILLANQEGEYLITQNAVSLLARQSHTESLQQVIADDDGNLLSLDIGDDITAESITQENEERILMSFPFIPAQSEVIIDSVSNPRTVDDIVFAPFINYRYQ